MQIEWNILCPLEQETISLMERAASQCLESESVAVPCLVTVCLCDDDNIKLFRKDI